MRSIPIPSCPSYTERQRPVWVGVQTHREVNPMSSYGPHQIIGMANAQGIFLREQAGETPFIEITRSEFDYMVLDRFARLMEKMFKINFVTDRDDGDYPDVIYHNIKFQGYNLGNCPDWALGGEIQLCENPDLMNEALEFSNEE